MLRTLFPFILFLSVCEDKSYYNIKLQKLLMHLRLKQVLYININTL
jgi:hypothetical protein